MKKLIRGQSFLEYSVIIIVIAAALIAMRVYLVRSVQEKYRQSADVFGEGEQYAQGVTQTTENRSTTDITPPTDGRDVCPNILAQIDRLRQENADLLKTAADLDRTVAGMRAQAQILLKSGFKGTAAQANQLLQRAQELAEEANSFRQRVIDNNQTIANLTASYPDCF